MTRRERLQFFWIWVVLGVVPLFLRPLWEPDEARYSEIPREMIARGDWLTPVLNGVHYFEKPPFQYWLSAVGEVLFGQNAWAPRLPLALASFLAMAMAWRMARRLGARRPVWAAFMVASALLAYVCHQVLTLDALFSAFLVTASVCFVEAVAAHWEGVPRRGWTLGAFLALALAFLTKGLAAPVLLGGVLLGALPFAWREERLRRAVFRVLLDPLGWLLFLAISAPWFIAMERAYPGHARFFFIHEHFARFTSTVHNRAASANPWLDKLFFVWVLGVGLLPWLSSAWVGIRRGLAFLRHRGLGAEDAALHRWVMAVVLLIGAVPFIFFTFSHSKLPPYILPAIVPLAALACAMEREGEEPAALRRHGWELLFLGAAFGTAAFTVVNVPSALPWVWALATSFLLLGGWAFWPKGLTAARWMAALAGSLLLLTLAAQRVVGPRKSVSFLVAKAPKDAQWISHGYYYQAIAYHTGARVAVVSGTGELSFGRERLSKEEQAQWFRDDPHALQALAQRMREAQPSRPVWALSDRDDWEVLTPEEQGAWQVVDQSPGALLLRFR